MYSSSVIFGLYVLCIAASISSSGGVGHCDTIVFEPGISYSWIIPPQSQSSSNNGRPSSSSSSSSPDRPSVDFDPRNESPLTPVGGFGHPPFYLRHSQEQLSLPNEFLITPSDPQQRNAGAGGGGGGLSQPPLFQQLDPNKPLMNQVDCNGDPTCPNVDITQQQQRQYVPTMHQSNIAAVPSITPSPSSDDYQQRSSVPVSLGQPVSWPTTHNGGIGLLFFISESASHLPVEQLIRQQLVLHRTQFPFDISINCEDAAGTGCLPGGRLSQTLTTPFSPATTLNGRNVENGNYASLPLFEIVNSSSRRGNQEQQQQQQQQQRKWRTIGERIVRNKHHRLEQQLEQQQWQQQQQQRQQELSILP